LERYLREAKLQPRKEGDAAHSSTDYETNPNFDHMPAVQPGRAGEVQPPPAAATPRLTMEEIEGVRYNLDKICLFSARVRDAVCNMALESLDLQARLEQVTAERDDLAKQLADMREQLNQVNLECNKVAVESHRWAASSVNYEAQLRTATAELSTLRGQVMGLETVVAHFKALAERTK